MPEQLFMREYLERVGVNTKQCLDEKSLKAEYLRHIYRLDARDKLIDSEGKLKGKTRNPRHLH